MRVTGSLRVYMWKSENDFSEKEGGGALLLANPPAARDGAGKGMFYLTVFTSPAISLSLAFSYFLPL